MLIYISAVIVLICTSIHPFFIADMIKVFIHKYTPLLYRRYDQSVHSLCGEYSF